MTIAVLFLVIALVCFAVAAWGYPTGRWGVGWAGAFFATLAFLWPHIAK